MGLVFARPLRLLVGCPAVVAFGGLLTVLCRSPGGAAAGLGGFAVPLPVFSLPHEGPASVRPVARPALALALPGGECLLLSPVGPNIYIYIYEYILIYFSPIQLLSQLKEESQQGP